MFFFTNGFDQQINYWNETQNETKNGNFIIIFRSTQANRSFKRILELKTNPA